MRRSLLALWLAILGIAVLPPAPSRASTEAPPGFESGAEDFGEEDIREAPPESDAEGEDEDGDEDDEEYDAEEGMDPSGRIPKPDLPDDLKHPSRWRYIPEGRIKPGNFFQRFLITSFAAPFVFRDEDVGTGGGLAITDIDFRHQRRREFAGIFVSYTTEEQRAASIVWRRWIHHRELPAGGVIQEERSFWRASASYRKTLTRRFFGFGAGSDEDDETRYDDEHWGLEFGFERAIPDPGDNLVLAASLRGDIHELGRGEGKRSPGTELIPEVFRDDREQELGWVVAGLRWDTRDSQRNPYRGFSVGGTVESLLLQDDWDVGARWTLDAVKIFPFWPLFHDGGDAFEENPPTDTLAFNLRTQLTSGDLPFTEFPALGGSYTLRGFVQGRFRDDASWHGSAEYRLWVIPRGFKITKAIRVERIGVAPFFDIGSVAGNGANLFESRVKTSYGIGLRILLERAAPFRVDFGFSNEDFILSARFGYSF